MALEKVLPLYILVSFQIFGSLSQTVNLTIADGDIQGLVGTTIRENATYYSFRGMPYAQPPVGNLRFANPVKNEAWNGTRDATYDRVQCLQHAGDSYFSASMAGQEDCLYINVYTPDYTAQNLSVLVWIHGGAFFEGNSSYESFGPDYFLEQDLVFVSFNYRLGIFGFLSTEDEACPGNWGIKDQILALKWVQENIAYFGGNPENVTIYGESAGAVSVHLLMQTNLTEGLFHRAIMNSGTSLNLWALNTRAKETATLIGVDLAIVTTNTTKLIEELRQQDAETLQYVGWFSSLSLFIGDGLRGLPFGPVMEPDIEGAVYINPSENALSNGEFRQVPVLMGLNSNEAGSAEGLTGLIRFYLVNYDIRQDLLTPYSMTDDYPTRLLVGIYIKLNYFGLEAIALNTDGLDDFVSADQFNRPIRRAAVDMSNYTTVYFYEFGYQGEMSGVDRTYNGTAHAEDNSYLFRSYNNYTEEDVEVSEMLVLLWSNFVKYGDPTPEPDERLNNVTWSPVDPDNSDFIYMSLNETMVSSVNPKQTDWEYYTTLWEQYGDDDDELTTY